MGRLIQVITQASRRKLHRSLAFLPGWPRGFGHATTSSLAPLLRAHPVGLRGLRFRRKLPPNNSFKPPPHCGAAHSGLKPHVKRR